MPAKSKSELPQRVKGVLPSRAQEIYREAYNSAYDNYGAKSKRRGSASREETASRVAWNAVKKKYQKGDDGKWHPQKK